MKFASKILVASLVLSASVAARADLLPVIPNGAYTLTNQDPAPNATVIDLSTLSFPVHDGDTLHLARVGTWAYGPQPDWPDTATALIGVFSSTNTILGTGTLNRIPGALAAGVPFVSQPTFYGTVPTDIPQDFMVDTGGTFSGITPMFTSVDIQVPKGAHYLFVSSYDSFYSTNSDPNGDFAISITQVSTPEPGSLLLLGLGGVAMLRRSRKRR
jgi:hypothetical protein